MADVIEATEALMNLMEQHGDFLEEEVTEEVVEELSEDELEDDSEEESEEAEEDSEEESEEEEGGSKEEVFFELQIGDEVYEVNEEELKAGYLRNEDYTAEVTKLQSQRLELEKEFHEKEQALVTAYNEVLAQISGDLSNLQNVDWEKLRQTNPEEYRDRKLALIEAQEKAQVQASKRRVLVEAIQKFEQEQYKKYLESQVEVARKLMPDFDKPEFKSELVKYGEKIGLTSEEVRGIADARHLSILDKARRYDELQARKKAVMDQKVSKDLPPVVKPGAPKATGEEKRSRVKQARAQLGKSGSIHDAAALFLARGVID